MKQRITPKQLKELSKKGRYNLHTWVYRTAKEDPDDYDGKEMLLSLGEMIELLMKKKINDYGLEIKQETGPDPKNWLAWVVVLEKRFYGIELVDTLWEAVKEILNN